LLLTLAAGLRPSPLTSLLLLEVVREAGQAQTLLEAVALVVIEHPQVLLVVAHLPSLL
jgi:hypothetical protein